MIAVLVYLVLVVVMLVAFAIRTPEYDVQTIAALSIFWPISLIVLCMFMILWSVKWDFDIANRRNVKRFEVRRPDDKWPGVAITLFHTEFQIWKKR